MIHIYYHIYAIDGVEEIIDEQLSLIENTFKFPYIINFGISIANKQTSTTNILSKINKIEKPNYKLREIKSEGNEFVTLDLILLDLEKFGNDDYILYIHTKGASKQNDADFNNIITWRHLMNYFLIEKYQFVFDTFKNSDFNTYGVLYSDLGKWRLYSGNFWWMKASYAKTLNLQGVKRNRFSAETDFIQHGINWKAYSPYDRPNENHYKINFKREEYAK